MAILRYEPYNKMWRDTAAVMYGSSRATAQRNDYRGQGSRVAYITQKKKRTGSRVSFKKLVEKTQPAKHLTGTPGTAMTHNTIYTFCPTTQVTQGTGNTNRIGDSIYIAALKFKGFLNSHTTAGAYSYRLIIGFSGEEYNPGSNFGSGLATTELFLPNTTISAVNGIINPKTFTKIHDSVMDMNSQISGSADILSFDHTVTIDQNFLYQSDASVYGKTRNLYVVIISNVVGGTSGVTPTGTMNGAVDLIFK